jgi:hypothetical protein
MAMSKDGQPDKTGRDEGGRFTKGCSGNPSGRPIGIRNKSALLIETLMAGDAEAISVSVIDAAKSGDMTAAKIVLDRLLPVRRDSPINLPLPQIKTAQDVAAAMASILKSVGSGELTPDEGQQLSKLLESYLKTLVSSNLEERLIAIETKISQSV